MKTKWKITSFAMIAMLISCGGGTNEQNNTAETTEESTPQMTTYDSPNSLYSISVPNEYEQKSTDNVGNLLFQNQPVQTAPKSFQQQLELRALP